MHCRAILKDAVVDTHVSARGDAHGATIRCETPHLTQFVGVIGAAFTSFETTFKMMDSLSPSDIHRVILLLMMLCACYLTSVAISLRDLWAMHKRKEQRASEAWRSETFRTSILQLMVRRGASSGGDLYDDGESSRIAQEALTLQDARTRAAEIEADRAHSLQVRHRIIRKHASR